MAGEAVVPASELAAVRHIISAFLVKSPLAVYVDAHVLACKFGFGEA